MSVCGAFSDSSVLESASFDDGRSVLLSLGDSCGRCSTRCLWSSSVVEVFRLFVIIGAPVVPTVY